jgi:2',3'-cyclic-nucleotide 2'-phosphodiesterase (5'-nucleotidase family)
MGQDARTAIIPSHVAGVDVQDPIPVVQAWVDKLRPEVDMVLALTHQGKTAPMQTDADKCIDLL